MHGVRVELLEAQAKSIGIPLHKAMVPEVPTMEEYDRLMHQVMRSFHMEGVAASIYGDIFLEDLRRYREKRLEEVGMEGLFPLWKRNTCEVVREFIDKGFQAVIVCVNEKYLDGSFVGRMLDASFLNDIPPTVDPCGENGEYHSFVFDGPIFSLPVRWRYGEKVRREYKPSTNRGCDPRSMETDVAFWYCDLIPHIIGDKHG